MPSLRSPRNSWNILEKILCCDSSSNLSKQKIHCLTSLKCPEVDTNQIRGDWFKKGIKTRENIIQVKNFNLIDNHFRFSLRMGCFGKDFVIMRLTIHTNEAAILTVKAHYFLAGLLLGTTLTHSSLLWLGVQIMGVLCAIKFEVRSWQCMTGQ